MEKVVTKEDVALLRKLAAIPKHERNVTIEQVNLGKPQVEQEYLTKCFNRIFTVIDEVYQEIHN